MHFPKKKKKPHNLTKTRNMNLQKKKIEKKSTVVF